MESDDDFQLLPSPEVASPLVSRRKLKRLKKASEVSEDFLKIDDQNDDSPPVPELNTSEFEAKDSNKLNGQDFDESNELRQSESGSKDLDDGDNLDYSGLDGEENISRVKRALEFDSVTEINEKAEYQSLGAGEESNDPLIDGPEKNRHSLDAFEEEREAKKRNSKNKRLKSSGDGGNSNEIATSKRILEKERREYVEQLRAESQRLLRETRGAAFKPIPLVQKPISSVLEKIRQRKLELSRKSVTVENADLDDDSGDNLLSEIMMKHGSAAEGSRDDLDKECEAIDQHPGDVESLKDSMCIDGRSDGKNLAGCEGTSSERTADEIAETFQAPVDDTQELFSDSQTSNKDDVSNESSSNYLRENFTPSVLALDLKLDSAPLDDILNETSSGRLQENFTPSILAMNLKLDSAVLDDISDEEDNEKENVDPRPHGLSNSTSLENGDPVKAFVDDEAEEEDDSDHDLRFRDEEEDEDTDSEELHDLVATAYEENPFDSERRNELHQKWLEQQDTAGTENLLQKLKYGSKFIKSTLLEDENNEGDTDDFEFGDAAIEDMLPLNVARMNIRKVKQMLPHMFTDKDDQYMSDDEETERRLEKERVFEKAEGKSIFLSPAEDESTREVFGLIKKLNVVPDVKKRHKAPSFLDTPLIGESKNTSSKSSFLGRSSNLSCTSSHKHGSRNSRSFVFGRDDSNSRSAIATTEEPSDLGQSENKPTKIASAKFSYSQVRSSTRNPAFETKSGTSLFDILRHSSLQLQLQRKECTLGDESSQTSSVFAAFKLDKLDRAHIKKPIKTEGEF